MSMARKIETLFLAVISVIHVCLCASVGNVRTIQSGRKWVDPSDTRRGPPSKRTWAPARYPGTLAAPGQHYDAYYVNRNPPYGAVLRNTKKSDLPERGQIKFMKTLLGKVRTLLSDNQSKKDASPGKKAEEKRQDKIISSVASNNGKLYGILGDSEDKKEKEGDKAVNVISIPLNALSKFSKSDSDGGGDSSMQVTPSDVFGSARNARLVLRPLPVRSESDQNREEIPMSENKAYGQLLPVILQTPIQRDQGAPVMIVNPQARMQQPLSDFTGGEMGNPVDSPVGDTVDSPQVPALLERHGDIVRHGKSDDSLYRDIGHIPGETKLISRTSDEDTGKTSLKHKRPGRYHHSLAVRPYAEDDVDDREEDGDNDEEEVNDDVEENGEDGEDGEDDDDDDDDDDEDVEDEPYDRTSPRMNEEERAIAATRKRLFAMLPGNDPTYTSENRGLGLMRGRAPMQIPEAFLGNPMLRGMGFYQRNLLPFNGAALAGEHADNSNDRNVFMLGGLSARQVLGESSSSMINNKMQMPAARVNSGGFMLGGSAAQALSPNEVSYMLEKQMPSNGFEELSQKDEISRPRAVDRKPGTGNILVEVNGQPVTDSRELRDHVVNGRVFRGKGKLIKSKGPLDVKISRARDGVHSKVVDITSSDKVNVLDAKSKIAKSQ